MPLTSASTSVASLIREASSHRPPGTPAGIRLYPPAAVERIGFIRRAKELGFTLSEITDLLDLWLRSGDQCGPAKDTALASLDRTDRRISQFREMGAALRQVETACDRHEPMAECPLLANPQS